MSWLEAESGLAARVRADHRRRRHSTMRHRMLQARPRVDRGCRIRGGRREWVLWVGGGRGARWFGRLSRSGCGRGAAAHGRWSGSPRKVEPAEPAVASLQHPSRRRVRRQCCPHCAPPLWRLLGERREMRSAKVLLVLLDWGHPFGWARARLFAGRPLPNREMRRPLACHRGSPLRLCLQLLHVLREIALGEPARPIRVELVELGEEGLDVLPLDELRASAGQITQCCGRVDRVTGPWEAATGWHVWSGGAVHNCRGPPA